MSWSAAVLNTGCMKRCSVFIPTCPAYVEAFHGLARTMTGLYFTCTSLVPPEHGMGHTMCRAVHAWQTAAIREWMDAGCFTLRDAHAAGGLATSPMTVAFGESSSVARGVHPVTACFPTIRSVPRHVAFGTDGSWFPSHRCGSAFAAACLETLTWALYHVPIPCKLDHSYTVEVYTSWVLYCVKSKILASARVSCATARNLKEGGNFIDSKSFIMALHSRRLDDLGTGLMDLLLADCVR